MWFILGLLALVALVLVLAAVMGLWAAFLTHREQMAESWGRSLALAQGIVPEGSPVSREAANGDTGYEAAGSGEPAVELVEDPWDRLQRAYQDEEAARVHRINLERQAEDQLRYSVVPPGEEPGEGPDGS